MDGNGELKLLLKFKIFFFFWGGGVGGGGWGGGGGPVGGSGWIRTEK